MGGDFPQPGKTSKTKAGWKALTMNSCTSVAARLGMASLMSPDISPSASSAPSKSESRT